MPRAKQRTPALRDRVLQVALALLARSGVAGFTTREIARGARTSTPAVYELFGDKAGLVRGVFFEGFRLLRRYFDRIGESGDPRRDLTLLVASYRRFLRDHPVLAHVMFSRPFADFDPGPAERAAGSAVRELIVARVQRWIDAGALAGDATDIAHVLVAMTQGLAAAELAARLGTSPASIDRRWSLAVTALLDGLTAARPAVTARFASGPPAASPAGRRATAARAARRRPAAAAAVPPSGRPRARARSTR